MDYKELAEKAREIDAKATPGPWMWDLRECNHQCILTTTHSGKYYVIAGAAITSVGVGLIHFAAGVIAAGVLMLAGGVISAIFGGDGQ